MSIESANNWRTCWICSEPSASVEEHHIVPKELGGTDEPTNRMDICKTCHQKVTWGFANINYLVYMVSQVNSPNTAAWIRILFVKCGEYALRNQLLTEELENLRRKTL